LGCSRDVDAPAVEAGIVELLQHEVGDIGA
jgi:hypothetical protein